MKYLNALLGILCLIILLPSCLKSYVDNIQDENPVSKSNKAGVSKSSLDTFLVFSDTSALISTMADLENQSDSVLSAFEDSYSFVSMRKFYEDKLDNATDTFEQNRWEDRPVEMNEFATVVSPSGLIQLEDTLYLVDVEGGALYFTQNITSSGISQLKSPSIWGILRFRDYFALTKTRRLIFMLRKAGNTTWLTEQIIDIKQDLVTMTTGFGLPL